MIEVAFVLAFVVLPVGLGALEFGNLYYKYHLIENAVRDGARFASSLSSRVCSDGTLQEKVRSVVKRASEEDGFWDSADIGISCSSFDNSSYSYRGGPTIYTVTVTSSVRYNSLGYLGFLAFLNLGDPMIVASHQERIVGG